MERISRTLLWASQTSRERVIRLRARKGSVEQRMKQARKRAEDLQERGEMPRPPCPGGMAAIMRLSLARSALLGGGWVVGERMESRVVWRRRSKRVAIGRKERGGRREAR